MSLVQQAVRGHYRKLHSRSSREPALRALPPAAQVVRFDKVRKEANGLQPLASFFLLYITVLITDKIWSGSNGFWINSEAPSLIASTILDF